jgi:hypothetical protein
MADNAIQLTPLAQGALRGIPTAVEAERGRDASATEIIKCVVRI